MIRIVTILVPLMTATAFAIAVPIGELFSAVQPMMVALSVMTAAVLVRLNRGMPTVDWKTLQAAERKNLTSAILSVTREYLHIASIFTISILFLLFITTIGKERAGQNIQIAKFLSGTIGLLLSLCVIRMSYVAWRDFDIVKLQKFIIDSAADREQAELAKTEALAKVETMKLAGLQAAKPAAPEPWPD